MKRQKEILEAYEKEYKELDRLRDKTIDSERIESQKF